MSTKRSQNFSIDDAFEEEHTDAIRVYGATTTTERSPLRSTLNGYLGGASSSSSDAVTVHIQDPGNPLGFKPILRGLAEIRTEHDTASKDSDSLIAESSDFDFDPSLPWYQHPKVKEHWKMVLAAFSLLFIGLGLCIAGLCIVGLPISGVQGAVFFIAGIICLIPGAYHVIYIYLAVKLPNKYDFNFLPLFN